ncbi:YbaN family protein [bacterium]|nr:YbaN family protein [bacterium]
MNTIKKYLLISLGFVSLGLGIVGIFLPILPTAPFLILTAFCFMQTSQRLHHWLIHNKIVGSYILDYFKYRAITGKTKIIALIWLWGSMGISMYLVPRFYIKLLLAAIAAGVSFHILSLRSRHDEKISNPEVAPEALDDCGGRD